MVEQSFRTERDSMGEVKVPKGAYYGGKTAAPVSKVVSSWLPPRPTNNST